MKLIVIRDSGVAPAPLEKVFRLSTSVPLVQRTLGFTPVEGVTTGHIQMSSTVLWRGWLFGLPQYHLTRITGFQAPEHGTAFFQDSQERGRFRFFQHDHHYTALPDGSTRMDDEIRFCLPFGFLGRLVARLIMEPHIRRLVKQRFALIARVAASDEAERYL